MIQQSYVSHRDYLLSALLVQWFFFIKNIHNKLLEQKLNTTFLVKLEKNATYIYKILQQGFGEGTMSRTQVFVSDFRGKERHYR
jgi:hypothetical protein